MKKLLFLLIATMLTACITAQYKVNLVVQKTSPMLYLYGEGGQLKWNGPITLTQSSGKLTLAGGNLDLGTNNLLSTGSLGATAARLTKVWSVNAEFSNAPTINGVSLSSVYAPLTSPTFVTGITTPALTLGSTLLSVTGNQLNFLNTATSDIQAQINAKQATLVSATNIKTVGGISLLGSGDIPTGGTGTVTSVGVTTANGVSAAIVNPTTAADITFTLGAITPTSVNGITMSGGSTPTLAVTGTSAISGTNTGDNSVNTLYSGLVSNATHTGDVTGSVALTIANASVTLAKMANMTGGYLIYRKTGGAGAPEVQTLATLKTDLGLTGTNSGDQTDITGNAATATKLLTARTINGLPFDGTANISVPSNITPGTAGNVMVSNGTLWTSGTVSGIGSVTTVGVATANGVSASVTNPTSTPELTFSLGSITPTSVNGVALSGTSTPTLAVSGASSISGVNTGDNAVNTLYSGLTSNASHTGDVVGSVNLVISNSVVTLAKMANVGTATVFYRRTASTGPPEVQTLGQLKTDLGLAGTNTGDQTTITGNAGSATILQTARTINGVSFNGSASITVPSNITAGTSGNVMTSNGTLWTSAAPAITLTNTATLTNKTLTLPIFNGGVALTTTSTELNALAASGVTGTLELATAIPALTGVQMPGLTTTQINAISTPAEGLMVFDTTLHVMKFWDGTSWKIVQTN